MTPREDVLASLGNDVLSTVLVSHLFAYPYSNIIQPAKTEKDVAAEKEEAMKDAIAAQEQDKERARKQKAPAGFRRLYV